MTNNLPTITEYNKFLETLTEDERKIALQILDDFSHEGSSDLYNKLVYADYEEVPVDIDLSTSAITKETLIDLLS